MVAKLYRTSKGYVVADDIFIQRGEFIDGSPGDWVASGVLDQEEIDGLILGEIELRDFDLDAEQAEDLKDFVEVPENEWVNLLPWSQQGL